ncbi:MAG TPA: hypothetical protein VKV03_01190 [Candidatus Binataceae bacterium]|nr:hypothetical protein [Candidatus Binataceae bacterium]
MVSTAIALVCFGFLGLTASTSGLAQSNIPAGVPLVPSATGPLSSAPPTGASSGRLTTLTPLSLPAAAPSTAAAAPGAPAALTTTSALPVLNPAPLVVAGGPTPIPQSIFNCSCFGIGLGTRWVGRVQSTNFQSASTAAAAQCTAYAINSGTQSPYIAPPGGVSLGRNPYPGVNPNGAPGNVATSFRGTSVFTETSAAETGVPPRAAGCARCACD